uniref:AB hydrolase-1 domain-containing protein n=1 Tax=Scophthalmus maximus TaxID=52904 RepID=A0A8D3C1K8_SCOMX
MKRAASFLITVYASVPVVLHLFPWILVRLPFFVDLDRPEDVLNHTCNFYLGTEEGVSVGVWHTLPASKWEEAAGKSPEWYRGTLGDGHPVVIYLHGNVGTRWDENFFFFFLLQILSAAGYHVLSLDYRGFGDSSGEPSEAGMTSDALYLYKWAKTQSKGSLVCLWGHSLGSGVATNAAFELQLRGGFKSSLALVQQNMTKYSYRSFCGARFNVSFSPTPPHSLKFLTCPLLILHAEDDNSVEMISYSANLGFSHSNIYLDPNLPNVVR